MRHFLLAACILFFPAAAHAKLGLGLPVDCILGETCFIQNYFDQNREDGQAQDYACGSLAYDEHKGTDFRVPTYADLERGINVLAVAGGTVRSVHMQPVIRENDIPMLKLIKYGMMRPCGSLIRIEHDKGWESFYCHLDPKGTRVQEGDRVEQGQVIGRMGRSGESIFPHLHYELRHYGNPVDPFVGYANPFDCSKDARFSQWSDEAEEHLAYDAGGLVAAGFTAKTPDAAEAREGRQAQSRISPSAPELHFWVELYGVRRYDRLEIRLTAPDGTLLAEMRVDYDAPFALAFEKLQAAREGAAWPQGSYMADVRLQRFEHVWPETVTERRWLVDVAE